MTVMDEGDAIIGGNAIPAAWADFGHRAEVVLSLAHETLEERIEFAEALGIELDATIQLELDKDWHALGGPPPNPRPAKIERLVFFGQSIGLWVTWHAD